MRAIPIILAAAATAVTLGVASPASAYWRDNDDWYRWHHHHRHYYYQAPYYYRGGYYYYSPQPYWPYYPPRAYYRSW